MAIGVVIDMAKEYIPREEGNRWDLLNLHALLHYPRDISRYGPPNEYTTWFMEAGHKHHVKLPGKTVGKVKGMFDHGLAINIKSQYELKMFLECANVQNEVIYLSSDDESNVKQGENGGPKGEERSGDGQEGKDGEVTGQVVPDNGSDSLEDQTDVFLESTSPTDEKH